MGNWKLENGIEVVEKEFDYDLHVFEVYNQDALLGTIYPNSIESMRYIIFDLDDGHDPIAEAWEDGRGNTCNIDGWE